MRIIAIDPGYERLGVAVLERQPPKVAPSHTPPRQPPLLGGIKGDSKREVLLYSACIQTPKTLAHAERLAQIGNEVQKAIAAWKPAALAIESLFLFSNQKTAMRVSEARGVCLYEAARAGLTVHEYTPLEVKIAVTGYGKSDKRQVTEMVKKLVALPAKKSLPPQTARASYRSGTPFASEARCSRSCEAPSIRFSPFRKGRIRLDDEYDAIAIGLTHLAMRKLNSGNG
ncbi:MAG: crossover junction endodeoxyribonuclease RuvC [Patescibacteria group bacterium]